MVRLLLEVARAKGSTALPFLNEATAGSSQDASTLVSGSVRPRSQSDLAVDAMLAEYKLVEHIGSGAFGHVWRAWSATEERDVAIKVLPAELSRDDQEMQRVKQCFKNVHHLQHQHICPVYRLGYDERYGYYLVMRYVAGAPLNQWRDKLGDSPPPLQQVIDYLGMAGAALDYAHLHRVVHRDIKPGNLLRSPAGDDLQVVDFGLSEQIHSSMSRVSGASLPMVGTPAYMSPESCRGSPQDGRSDQYSLACVAYYLLSGRPPFDSTPWIVVMCHLERMPVPVRGLSEPLNKVLLRALAKEPAARFPKCADFVHALREASKPVRIASATAAVAAQRSLVMQAEHWNDSWLCPSYKTPAQPVIGIAFARHNERLFVLRSDGAMDVWSPGATTLTRLATFMMPPAHSIAVTPQGGFLIAANDERVVVFDPAEGRRIMTFEPKNDSIAAICTVPRTPAEVGCLTRRGQLIFADVATGAVRRTLRTRSGDTLGLCVANKNPILVEYTRNTLSYRSLKTSFTAPAWPKLPRDLTDRIDESFFTSGDSYFLVRRTDGRVLCANPASGKLLWISPAEPLIRHVAVDVGELLLLAAMDGPDLRIIDMATGRPLPSVGLPCPATRVAISDHGRVAVALLDNRVLIAERLPIVRTDGNSIGR